MRIPKIYNYTSFDDKETVILPESEYNKPTYIMYDDRTRFKFIKTIEKYVRGSYEYKQLIEYLHSQLGMTYDMFFNNVSKSTSKRISIEIHHLPFTLYDIVNVILTKFEAEDIPLDPYAIAEEVTMCHYKGMVTLVPLSVTVHQLYHRGDIFIPVQYMDKGFVKFYQTYKPYMKDYEGMLIKLVAMSKAFDIKTANSILRKHLIYLENFGYVSIPKVL